jgi:aminopeptidase N
MDKTAVNTKQLNSIMRNHFTMSQLKINVLIIVNCLLATLNYAQFTSNDSIRGGYGKTRNWWHVIHYDLSIEFDNQQKTISGKNTIRFQLLAIPENAQIQIDLQAPMIIDSVFITGEKIERNTITSTKNAYFIPYNPLVKNLKTQDNITVFFHGSPRVAVNPPWDGGIMWKKSANNLDWITVACQGLGASCWFPCKDSQYDEPDSVRMNFTYPSQLICVSNGTKIAESTVQDKSTTSWSVKNPINTYCMIPYIGDYVCLRDTFQGEAGILPLEFWVIRGNEEKALTQFHDAKRTLRALEYWFGKYPFYSDGYKLVETPHLGMEHQSAIAYGNKFQNGYLGKDLSGTGIGLKWDFIIVHESGHEWFGNNITSKDVADMWIHEGFTTYSEVLFTDYWYGTKAGNSYSVGLRKNINNDRPLIGQYGVQNEGSGDMYSKGAALIHTIRTLVNNDTLFRNMLREMNTLYYHKTVTSMEIEQFMSNYLRMNLTSLFDQYLRTNQVPMLVIRNKRKATEIRWENCIPTFDMPVIYDGKQYNCSTQWQKIGRQIKPRKLSRQLYYNL